MTNIDRVKWTALCIAVVFLAGLLLLPCISAAQEEVTSAIRRYKQYEVSRGFYEEYEVAPGRAVPLVEIPGVTQGGVLSYSPSAAPVRIRTRLADSHQGLKFYNVLRCQYCHTTETDDIHTTRANITCRQCHGAEPIASLNHYFSPFNPIRRHAYVCAKCHEGASASYASYVVHEPNPALASTKAAFPVLFYVFWLMVALAVGTFAVFLPHAAMWGIREMFIKKEKPEGERKD